MPLYQTERVCAVSREKVRDVLHQPRWVAAWIRRAAIIAGEACVHMYPRLVCVRNRGFHVCNKFPHVFRTDVKLPHDVPAATTTIKEKLR